MEQLNQKYCIQKFYLFNFKQFLQDLFFIIPNRCRDFAKIAKFCYLHHFLAPFTGKTTTRKSRNCVKNVSYKNCALTNLQKILVERFSLVFNPCRDIAQIPTVKFVFSCSFDTLLCQGKNYKL